MIIQGVRSFEKDKIFQRQELLKLNKLKLNCWIIHKCEDVRKDGIFNFTKKSWCKQPNNFVAPTKNIQPSSLVGTAKSFGWLNTNQILFDKTKHFLQCIWYNVGTS